MNRRFSFALLILLFITVVIGGSAFSKTFLKALPGYHYVFPNDHASHPQYKTEWWYYTGHLKSKTGKQFGYELTFFRIANPSDKLPKNNWALTQTYMTHFAISDITAKQFYHTQRISRGALSQAGADEKKYVVWNKNWSAKLVQSNHLLQANTPDYALNLTLNTQKSPTINGEHGVSQKADCVGCASYYYSLTDLASAGEITIGKETYKVTGQSWMDHEFGSNQLSPKQVGWDWFSIQLNDHREIMLYQMRNKDGSIDRNSSGTVVMPNGQTQHLKVSDFKISPTKYWVSPQTHSRYPMLWTVTLFPNTPKKQTVFTVTPAFENQELYFHGKGPAYWEGAAAVTRTGQLKGQAYVEMTGYKNSLSKLL